MTWTLSAFADEAGPTCAEQIKALHAAGLTWIDLRAIDGHNISALPVEQAKAIRSQLDAAGIRVNMLGSPLGKIDLADDLQTDLAKLRHLGALAPVLGCRAIRIFSYYNKKAALPRAAFEKQALARLQQLTAVAADLGLVLYHENESAIFGEHLPAVLTIIRELRTVNNGRPGTFRTIFDFGNYTIAGDKAWENWLALRDVTDAFHLKETTPTPQGRQHVPVGHGDGSVPRILADALARAWSGPLTVEPHLHHSPAVLATGPSGRPNQDLAQMTAPEVFALACAAALKICREIKAPV